jgi:hypothetical protein
MDKLQGPHTRKYLIYDADDAEDLIRDIIKPPKLPDPGAAASEAERRHLLQQHKAQRELWGWPLSVEDTQREISKMKNMSTSLYG